jgi:hypothetical protein
VLRDAEVDAEAEVSADVEPVAEVAAVDVVVVVAVALVAAVVVRTGAHLTVRMTAGVALEATPVKSTSSGSDGRRSANALNMAPEVPSESELQRLPLAS